MQVDCEARVESTICSALNSDVKKPKEHLINCPLTLGDTCLDREEKPLTKADLVAVLEMNE